MLEKVHMGDNTNRKGVGMYKNRMWRRVFKMLYWVNS